MTSLKQTQQISSFIESAQNGSVVPLFVADAAGQVQSFNALYSATITNLSIETYLPELPEIPIELDRARSSQNASGFTEETYPYLPDGRYLGIASREKGGDTWQILREVFLPRREGVEREVIDLLRVLGGSFFRLGQVELGLMVLNKGAGQLGASEYIRCFGAVEETYTPAEIITGGDSEMDWRLGDYIVSAAQVTALEERWGKLWMPLNGNSMGSAASAASFKDDRLVDLYALFWASSHTGIGGGKGANALEDWNANKVLSNIVNMSGRTLAVATLGDLLEYGGSDTQTLVIANMPPHDHGKGNHDHDIPDFDPVGYSSSGNTGGGFGNSTDYANPDGKTVASGDIIASQGSSAPFSIEQPTGYIAQTVLVCAGQ